MLIFFLLTVCHQMQNENDDKPFIAKLLLLGDSDVGKTSIIVRFADQAFHTSVHPTIGVDYQKKTLTVHDQPVELEIWDTSGQERFESIARNFYRGAMGVIIVFDLTSYQSFRNIERWLENICTEADSRVIRVVVGNKCDLKEREVSKEDIKLLTEHYGLCYFETSAKTGEKINNLFQFMAERIYDEWADKPSNLTQSQTLRKNKKKEKNDFCCF